MKNLVVVQCVSSHLKLDSEFDSLAQSWRHVTLFGSPGIQSENIWVILRMEAQLKFPNKRIQKARVLDFFYGFYL